jgi:hypothetical protein
MNLFFYWYILQENFLIFAKIKVLWSCIQSSFFFISKTISKTVDKYFSIYGEKM